MFLCSFSFSVPSRLVRKKGSFFVSNYDVIETFLSGEKKKLVPASIVQKEGDLQFTKYLPIARVS